MRKIILCLLIMISCVSAKDILITFTLNDTNKTHLYEKLVAYTGLRKGKPDNYHVTIAHITNVDDQDYDRLNSYLRNTLALYTVQEITFTPGHASRYLNGGRTFNACPIVLCPAEETANFFKVINAGLSAALDEFRAPSGKKYAFKDDVRPDVYLPHITLANTKYIAEKNIDRSQIIKKVNGKIKENKGLSFKLTS